MTPTIKTSIELYCYNAVSSMFATMHNPKKRGKKFSWNDFPTTMQNYCGTMVIKNINIPKQYEENAQRYASEKGKNIAQTMVNLMSESTQKKINPDNQLNLKL